MGRKSTYPERLMEIWARWAVNRRELGWPSQSCEVRAFYAALTATETRGVARWRGSGAPPPMPRETARAASSRPLPIDSADLGPQVNRLLLDMAAEGRRRESLVLQIDALRQETVPHAARGIGLAVRGWYRYRRRGLQWLAGAMQQMEARNNS